MALDLNYDAETTHIISHHHDWKQSTRDNIDHRPENHTIET